MQKTDSNWNPLKEQDILADINKLLKKHGLKIELAGQGANYRKLFKIERIEVKRYFSQSKGF